MFVTHFVPRFCFIALCLCSFIILPSCSLLPAKQAAEPVVVVDTQAKQDLIAQIEEDIEAFRLTTPADNNALSKIQQLHLIDPEANEIATLTRQVAARYSTLIESHLQNKDAKSAEQFWQTANEIDPTLPDLENLATQITELKQQLKKERQQAAEEAQANATEEQAATETSATSSEGATEETLQQQNISDSEGTQLAIATPPTNFPLQQQLIDARSNLIGHELDKAGKEVIAQNAKAVIHARSMRDYRWLSALLKTSVYLLDSEYQLHTEPNIDDTAEPTVVLAPQE